MNVRVRRALLSVSDKSEIVALARTLDDLGCELIPPAEHRERSKTQCSRVTGDLPDHGQPGGLRRPG